MLLENVVCTDFVSLTMGNFICKKPQKETDAMVKKNKKRNIMRRHSRGSTSFWTSRNAKFRNMNNNFHSKSAEGYSPIEANMG